MIAGMQAELSAQKETILRIFLIPLSVSDTSSTMAFGAITTSDGKAEMNILDYGADYMKCDPFKYDAHQWTNISGEYGI